MQAGAVTAEISVSGESLRPGQHMQACVTVFDEFV